MHVLLSPFIDKVRVVFAVNVVEPKHCVPLQPLSGLFNTLLEDAKSYTEIAGSGFTETCLTTVTEHPVSVLVAVTE